MVGNGGKRGGGGGGSPEGQSAQGGHGGLCDFLQALVLVRFVQPLVDGLPAVGVAMAGLLRAGAARVFCQALRRRTSVHCERGRTSSSARVTMARDSLKYFH